MAIHGHFLFFFIDYKIGLVFFTETINNYEFKVQFFINNFEALFYPTLLGSLPIAFIIWFITYYTTKNLLKKRYEKKIRLGVNIDHVATLRNARNENFPNLSDVAIY